jgi:hypothetical protein
MSEHYMNGRNKESSRASRRRWYHRNKQHAIAIIKEREAEIRQWFREYKTHLKCAKCVEDHPACLDFHHRDPTQKDISLSKAPGLGWSVERILQEIEKCDVLCSNCHRKYHWECGANG